MIDEVFIYYQAGIKPCFFLKFSEVYEHYKFNMFKMNKVPVISTYVQERLLMGKFRQGDIIILYIQND